MFVSALAIKANLGVTFMLGLCIGVGIGSAIGLVLAIKSFNKLVNSNNGRVEGFIEKWVQPRVYYTNSDPLLLYVLGRMTDSAVQKGGCGICDEANNLLLHDRFNPLGHAKNCPVCFARAQYDRVMANKAETDNKESQDAPMGRPGKKVKGIVGKAAAMLFLSPSSK